MATKKRHNTAFVVGSVIGGLAGAAAALWKTPYSGNELRGKLTSRVQSVGSSRTGGTSITATPQHGQSFKDKMLSKVENTLAPVVGVKLGKTANDGGTPGTSNGIVRTFESSGTGATGQAVTTSMGPGSGSRPQTGTVTGDQGSSSVLSSPEAGNDVESSDTGVGQGVTPVDQGGEAPSRMSPPTREGEPAVASIEELTRPQIEIVPDAFKQEQGKMNPFPKLGGTENA